MKDVQQCELCNNVSCPTMWVVQQCKSYECSIVFSQDRSIDWRVAFIPRAINIRGRHPHHSRGATTYHSIRRPHAVSHSYFWFKTCFCLVFVLVYSQCVWLVNISNDLSKFIINNWKVFMKNKHDFILCIINHTIREPQFTTYYTLWVSLFTAKRKK